MDKADAGVDGTRTSWQGKLHRGLPVEERSYRRTMGDRFRSWICCHRESDLWIGVSPDSWRPAMEEAAHEVLLDARAQIEKYVPPAECAALGHAHFLSSLSPLPDDPDAQPVVRAMLRAGVSAGVGPMAAVAGAVAEYVGRALVSEFSCDEVLIENGGDLWLSFVRPLEIAVFAGRSPLSGRFCIELAPSLSPCGLCTSSGTVGPSLSFGYADASVILCADAALADAWATASCNAVQRAEDIEVVLAELGAHREILGSLIVVGDRMGVRGQFRIRPLH